MSKKTEFPDQYLAGRTDASIDPGVHYVNGLRADQQPDSGEAVMLFGLGCFWGAERLFWQQPGVVVTAVGYGGGQTPNPTYEEVCSGLTGHTELVRVVYKDSPEQVEQLLRVFWEAHDPTQGMRQGNDVGTQYRSALYCTSAAQLQQADASRERYQQQLKQAGAGDITTEIKQDTAFYYAEPWHQQYLAKNPQGYCGLRGTGVSCPLPT